MRPGKHQDRKAIIAIIMETQGAHVSKRGTVTQVERMLNAARRRDDYCVLVAERDGKVRGFISAQKQPKYNLWEDQYVWCIEHLMGRNVLEALLTELRRVAGRLPIMMPVWWADFPRAGALDKVLKRMGFAHQSEVLTQEKTA